MQALQQLFGFGEKDGRTASRTSTSASQMPQVAHGAGSDALETVDKAAEELGAALNASIVLGILIPPCVDCATPNREHALTVLFARSAFTNISFCI